MKKPILFLLSVIFLFSCTSDSSNLKKFMQQFYKTYNNQDFETIEKMGVAGIGDFFKDFYAYFGKIENYELYKTSITSQDSLEKTELFYKCEYKSIDKPLYQKFVVIKNKQYKILDFSYAYSEEILENKEKDYNEVQKTADKYYQLLQNDDWEQLIQIFDKQFVIDSGYTEIFITTIKQRRDYYGKIQSHSPETFFTTPLENNTIAIDVIYYCQTDKNKNLYEALTFIKRNDGFKLINYKYSDSYQTLINM